MLFNDKQRIRILLIVREDHSLLREVSFDYFKVVKVSQIRINPTAQEFHRYVYYRKLLRLSGVLQNNF